MSKTQQEDTRSKVIREREARRERLKHQTLASGKKRPIKPHKKKGWIGGLVSVLVVVAVLLWVVIGYGLPQRYLTAMTVQGERVSVAEYNYYYNQLIQIYKNQMGQELDLNSEAPAYLIQSLAPKTSETTVESEATASTEVSSESEATAASTEEASAEASSTESTTTESATEAASTEKEAPAAGSEVSESSAASAAEIATIANSETKASELENPYGIKTWGDFFRYQVKQSIIRVKSLVQAAKAEGIELLDSDMKTIDRAIEQARGDRSELEFRNQLVQSYGKGFTFDLYKKVYGEQLLVGKYQTEHQKTLAVSEDELNNYLKANEDRLMEAHYQLAHIFVDTSKQTVKDLSSEKVKELQEQGLLPKDEEIKVQGESKESSEETEETATASETSAAKETSDVSGTQEASHQSSSESTEASNAKDAKTGESETVSTPQTQETTAVLGRLDAEGQSSADRQTEAVKAALNEQAAARMKAAADLIEAGLKEGRGMRRMVTEAGDVVQNGELGENGEDLLAQVNVKSNIYPKEVADWLFDEARQPGDVFRYQPSGENQPIYIVEFESRALDERLATKLHFRPVDQSKFNALSEEDREAKKKELEEALAKVDSLEAFEQLTVDRVTLQDAKELTVAHGLNLLPAQDEKRILADEVKEGDCFLLEVNKNFFAFYVDGRGEPSYREVALTTLRSEKMQHKMTELVDAAQAHTTTNTLGLWFTGVTETPAPTRR